jgi:hypothetical protein
MRHSSSSQLVPSFNPAYLAFLRLNTVFSSLMALFQATHRPPPIQFIPTNNH